MSIRSKNAELRRELADLGMEDEIPLPEAAGFTRILTGEHGNVTLEEVRHELLALLEDGQIYVYEHAWNCDEDTKPVSVERARALLSDLERYRYHLDDKCEIRVYYINVNTLLPEFR